MSIYTYLNDIGFTQDSLDAQCDKKINLPDVRLASPSRSPPSGSDSTEEDESEDSEVSAEDEEVNSPDFAPSTASSTDSSEQEFEVMDDDEDDYNPRPGYEVDSWTSP